MYFFFPKGKPYFANGLGRGTGGEKVSGVVSWVDLLMEGRSDACDKSTYTVFTVTNTTHTISAHRLWVPNGFANRKLNLGYRICVDNSANPSLVQRPKPYEPKKPSH